MYISGYFYHGEREESGVVLSFSFLLRETEAETSLCATRFLFPTFAYSPNNITIILVINVRYYFYFDFL